MHLWTRLAYLVLLDAPAELVEEDGIPCYIRVDAYEYDTGKRVVNVPRGNLRRAA